MSLRTMRQYATLPALPARGPMPPIVGVVIPIARTNLVTNPSIELATTNYTAVGGSIARSATQQYHGTYSLAVTPGAGTTDGAFYGSIALTNAQIYAFSCKFKGIQGVPYKISIATTGGVDLSVYTFTATGRWQWVYGYYQETSSTNRRFYFTKNGSTNVGIFYVDGVQIEAINAGELVSTYIDGDQTGLLTGQQPPAYLWTGTPHASTSTRSALTRAGGYVVNLSLYNFLLTGIIGLGMAVPNNISVPYTVLDGARYLRTQKPPRTLTLTGRWQSDDPREQFAMASDMRQAFDRDLVPIHQPLVLMVEPQDECGNVIGDFATVPCIYAGGLEGNDGNLPVEDVAPTFTMYVPYIAGGDAGAALTVQQTVTNANAIIKRAPDGTWSALGTGASGGTSVNALAAGLDGKIFAGGSFTAIGGVAAANIAYWDGSAWNAMGTGATGGTVDALIVAPNGDIYAGGTFTAMGGVANTNSIAKWNGSVWSAVGTGATTGNGVAAFVFDLTGNLYAGGSYTVMGGVANTVRIAKWDGAAWTALSTGANAVVNALTRGGDGLIYAGGLFTTIGGVSANNAAKWTGSAWVALASGPGGTVNSMTTGPNGLVYAGWAGGGGTGGVVSWNGTQWTTIGATNNNTFTLKFDGRGILWAAGNSTIYGPITPVDRVGNWNGSAWVYPDIDFPGSPIVRDVLLMPDGTVYMGFNTTGSATVAGLATVTNSTPGLAYPRLVINGPSSGTSRIYQFYDYTTGIGVWLDLTLSVGEVATLDFNPQAPSFTTTFQGDISARILPGSQSALFYLAPGNNNIAFFAAAATVVATLSWQKRYNGVADLVN